MIHIQRNRVVSVCLAATLVMSGLAFAYLSPTVATVQAQTTQEAMAGLPNTITVVGEGSTQIEPNIAVATIGVQVAEAAVQTASSNAQAIMEAVLAALQEQGIAEEDIQTTGFSIFAEFGPADPAAAQPQAPLYRVSNNVNVTIRDLNQVAAVLDAAIAAGANNIFGVTFSIDDASQAESDARAQAVAKAAAKAQELADLTNLQLGSVLSVSEVIGSQGGYFASPGLRADSAASMGGGSPIAPGQLNVSVQLEVVYSAAQPQ